MDDNAMLRETYRLAQDNNRMLHAMRRSAFFGGLIKIVIWIAVIVTPIWFYMTYMAPVVQSMAETAAQVQGVSTQASNQITQLQDALKRAQNAVKMPSFTKTSTSTTQ